MKDWTRTPTDWADDPCVHAIADALRIDPAQVAGHLLCVWSVLPAHARDGQLADVADSLLERWARWTGKRGAFAVAFRAHILDADGLWVLWEDLNGAVLREKDGDRQRAAERRRLAKLEKERQLDLLLAKGGHESAGPSGGPSGGPSPVSSAATNGRYGPTAVSAHARGNGASGRPAFVPGHAILPAPRFCSTCDGELVQVTGQKRPVRRHVPSCPHFTPLPNPVEQPA